MSFENIRLSPDLIEELYRNDLISEDGKQAAVAVAKEGTINHLGKNEKNTLVIVKEKDAVFLQDNDLTLLLRIINPCKLSMADISLINIDKTPADTVQLISQFKPLKIILFGAAPSDIALPMHFPPFQVQQYNNCSYLSSPSLSVLSEDVELKKQLWISLQKLFAL